MMGWLGSTNKFGFERGTDFPKKVNLGNFGAVAKGSQMAKWPKIDFFKQRSKRVFFVSTSAQ